MPKVQSLIAMPRSNNAYQARFIRMVSGHESVGNDGTTQVPGRERFSIRDSNAWEQGCEIFALRPGTADRNGNGFRRDTGPFRDRRRHATRRAKQKIEQVVAPNGPRAVLYHSFSNPPAPVGALNRSATIIMKRTLLWLIAILVIIACLAISFICGMRLSHQYTKNQFESKLWNTDIIIIMRMRAALDAHDKGNDKELYTTLCVALYSNSLNLIGTMDANPQDQRFRKSAVRLLGQAADYKRQHPESLAFLELNGCIPPETVGAFRNAISRLDAFTPQAEQGADGKPPKAAQLPH